MSAASSHPYDIAIVGLGITGVHHITREAEETIRRSAKTFVADQTPGVVPFLRTINSQLVDLSSRFKPTTHRLSTYRTISSEVVAAALERSPVCFATYGHPKVYSYPTVLIQRAAAILDLRVTVLAGISFLDTLLVDLNIDPGFDGLQMYEATDLLVRQRPLQTDVACIIAQPTVVAASNESSAARNAPNLALLEKYLLTFYPPDHQVIVVISRIHPLVEPILHRTRLAHLAATLSSVANSGTLYIPPIHRRAIANDELARRMQLGRPSAGRQ